MILLEDIKEKIIWKLLARLGFVSLESICDD